MRFSQARPLAGITDVIRHERSWMIKAGSHSLSFTRVDYRASFREEHRAVREAPQKWRLMTTISAILCLLGGGTTIALAVNSTRAAAGYRYVVSRPVPVAHAIRYTTPAPVHSDHPTRGNSISRATSIGKEASAPREDAEAGYLVDDLDPAPAAGGNMTAAVSAAMASGTLQQWATPDGHERGFVVVGPMEAGDAGCRSISILVRRDGDNQVERRRECTGGAATGIRSKP